MKDGKLGLSIKYKLLLLLTVIPVASLAIYIGLATRLFENDKITYVKDSSVAVARSIAVQLRLEMNAFVEKIKPIVETYDFNGQKFSEAAVKLFEQQERLDSLVLIQKAANGQYVRLGVLNKSNQFAQNFSDNLDFQEKMRQAALQGKISIAPFPESDLHLSVSTLIGKPEEVNHLIVVGLYRASDLYNAFMKTNIYQHFLLDKTGQKILGPQSDLLSNLAIQDIIHSTLPEGALDTKGERPLIVSYADAGVADMKVAAIVERADALTAVNVLMLQSLLFFVALIAITVIISVIASIKLTAALRNLFEATKLIAKGQFDVRVKKDSNDEVGGLADGFNFMAGEVSRLMIEASTKARMAGELETVKIVQETLFPAPSSQFGPYRVIGHIEAASECGGDWWNYNQVGDKLFLWIGDATGHGAPAAMVTSAAKSAASIIEDLEFMTPGKALEIMNKAIHETAKSKILMTFFIAAIDMKTGEMAYANASHEPPYIIRARSDGAKISKKDLEPLIEANGPRLGDRRSSKYVEQKVQLNPGDTILFYTDGIVDLMNPAGKAWGERGFVKSICESAAAGKSADQKIEKLKSNISQYRQNTELVDDITLFVCQYGEVA